MGVYKRGDVWWFKFNWNGKTIRESTKHTNKRVAEQIEAARKTALAKGEVGIRDRPPVPTFGDFAKNDFLPYVESHFADKRSTLAYYRIQVKHLTGHGPLSACAWTRSRRRSSQALSKNGGERSMRCRASTGHCRFFGECCTLPLNGARSTRLLRKSPSYLESDGGNESCRKRKKPTI